MVGLTLGVLDKMWILFFTDVPVWSKLETGRIPSASEMFQIVENHMRFGPTKSA